MSRVRQSPKINSVVEVPRIRIYPTMVKVEETASGLQKNFKFKFAEQEITGIFVEKKQGMEGTITLFVPGSPVGYLLDVFAQTMKDGDIIYPWDAGPYHFDFCFPAPHKEKLSQRATRGASPRALDNIVLTF